MGTLLLRRFTRLPLYISCDRGYSKVVISAGMRFACMSRSPPFSDAHKRRLAPPMLFLSSTSISHRFSSKPAPSESYRELDSSTYYSEQYGIPRRCYLFQSQARPGKLLPSAMGDQMLSRYAVAGQIGQSSLKLEQAEASTASQASRSCDPAGRRQLALLRSQILPRL